MVRRQTSDWFFTAILTFMVLALIAKLLSVWYYTSRGVNLGFPFNALDFNQFDRFTDYLLPWGTAGVPSFGDIWSPSYSWPAGSLSPAPYGPLQYAAIHFLPFRGSRVVLYGNFLLVLSAFAVLAYGIYVRSYRFRSPQRTLYFFTFILTCFPLHFLVDRGNFDLYGALVLAALYYVVLTKGRRDLPVALLFAALISLKPSFALFAIPLVLCVRFPYALGALALVAVNYSIPVLAYGASPKYMIDLVEYARTMIVGVSLYGHSAAQGLLAAGIQVGTWFDYAVGIILLVFLVLARVALRGQDKARVLLVVVTLTTLLTLIANTPSHDYRLVFLVPAFLSAPFLLPTLFCTSTSSRSLRVCFGVLLGCFAVIMSYINIPIPGVFNYITVLRSLALLSLFIIFMCIALPSLRRSRSGDPQLLNEVVEGGP